MLKRRFEVRPSKKSRVGFRLHPETARQTDFDFLGQAVIGRAFLEDAALMDQRGEGFNVVMVVGEKRCAKKPIAAAELPEAWVRVQPSEAGKAGNRKVAVVPWPTSLCTESEPPCKSAIDLTRARPRPVPSLLREASTR